MAAKLDNKVRKCEGIFLVEFAVFFNEMSIGGVNGHSDDVNEVESRNGCDKNTMLFVYGSLRVGVQRVSHVECGNVDGKGCGFRWCWRRRAGRIDGYLRGLHTGFHAVEMALRGGNGGNVPFSDKSWS